jgi:hypothetical protein
MFTILLLTTVIAAPQSASQADATCLHLAGETRENRDRSVAALGAMRAINTAESAFAATQARNGSGRKYATREELQGYVDPARYNLTPGAEVVPGFTLTLDAFDRGYWFEIVDTKDACGFRYVSNQNGLILVAQPTR